jgi:hypothetical protein
MTTRVASVIAKNFMIVEGVDWQLLLDYYSGEWRDCDEYQASNRQRRDYRFQQERTGLLYTLNSPHVLGTESGVV